MRIAKRFKRCKKLKSGLLLLLLIITAIMLFKGPLSREKAISQEPLIKLYITAEDKIIEMPLETYVAGTVAAEMPASFELEALKAQAVCARTYAVKKIQQKKEYPRKADLSDNIYTCQAYIPYQDFKKRHPRDYAALFNKIQKAVDETRGEIIIFQGEAIDALYHSTCGGKTESAYDVWGKAVPYLQAVKCEYCMESKHYQTVQVFACQDLLYLGPEYSKQLEIKVLSRSDSGRVKELEINQKHYFASRFRELLNLPSTWLNFQMLNDQLYINCRGYGHGVGMCQYGANGMAKSGKKYRDILKEYYHGISLYHLQYHKQFFEM